jgi:hypothetical protein
MDNDTRDIIANGDIFFFCGSGISFGSNLPSAVDILKKNFEIFLPSHLSESKKEELLNIQPEIFYELLIRITENYNCLDLWKCLHRKYNKSIPNISHFFIVYYSYKHKSPIITTNFDLMFEMAAEVLGIDYCVLLPEQPPPNDYTDSLYICKIHGSISDENDEFSSKGLWTTMTSITKMNIPWIEYLNHQMKMKHICFVGYSGRDIDFFPYLRGFSKKIKTKCVIWVNEFDKCEYSDKRAKECNAKKINKYPKDIFRELICTDILYSPVKDVLIDIDTDKGSLLDNIEKIKKEVDSLKLLNEDSKEILYISMLSALGKYKLAYDYASNFCKTEYNLPLKHRLILMLIRSRLNHEISRYETCGKFAKETISLIKNNISENLDVFIQSKCLVSESLRMNIPNDVYFNSWKGVTFYFFLPYVLLHFLYTLFFIKFYCYLNRKKISDLNSATQHEIIEHKIRFYAILQSLLWGCVKKDKKNIKKFFINIWDFLRNESYIFGYASGIANAGKFKYRIYPEDNTSSEANEIFSLTTSSTGQELMTRNVADRNIKDKQYDLARNHYRKYSEMAKTSGNKLNEIKGYTGIAYANYLQGIEPLLQEKEYDCYVKLIDYIEGKYWKKHLESLALKFRNKKGR